MSLYHIPDTVKRTFLSCFSESLLCLRILVPPLDTPDWWVCMEARWLHLWKRLVFSCTNHVALWQQVWEEVLVVLFTDGLCSSHCLGFSVQGRAVHDSLRVVRFLRLLNGGLPVLFQYRRAQGCSPVNNKCSTSSGTSWSAMEHQQGQGSQAEDGGFGPSLTHPFNHPSDVPGDFGKLRRPPGLGLQRRRPVGEADVQAVLSALPGSR